MLLVCLSLWLWFHYLGAARHRISHGRRRHTPHRSTLCARKPEWVIDEVVRLKAAMSEAGCRRIADTFNRMHVATRGMLVSKTWVAVLLRTRRLEVEKLRRAWKRRIPPDMPANRVRGADLTGKLDTRGEQYAILGIVDHGTRLAIGLHALSDRSTIGILRALLDAVERYRRPRGIRTDNEAVFASGLFRFVLRALGIRHQRTELHCPWMNGRVERLFGTLKQKLDGWSVGSFEELQGALGHFRAWYNHVRPHQHLGGRTPFEAWRGIDPYASAPREIDYFSAWDRLLTGYWLRR